MADDLGAPLGLRSMRRQWWRHLPFGFVGGSALAVVAMVMGVWVVFIEDPAGGEPSAVVKLDRSKTGIARADVAVAGQPKPANADGSDLAASPAAPGEPGAPGLSEAKPTGGDGALVPVAPAKRAPEVGEGQPLSTGPVPRVAEKSKYGILPKIAPDGSRPLDVYARPVPKRPSSTPPPLPSN